MTGPALSNYLAVAAVEIAGEVAAYKRSSRAAHVALLNAGRKLVDARESARRGQWAPFLEACGIEGRTARNWMMLARAGLTADDVTAAGGVQGAIDRLRTERAESNAAIASPDPDPKSPESEGERAPGDAERRPVVQESALAEGESRSVQADAPREPERAPRGRTLADIYRDRFRDRGSLQGSQAADSATDADAPLESDPERCPSTPDLFGDAGPDRGNVRDRGAALGIAPGFNEAAGRTGDAHGSTGGGMSLYAWRRSMGACTVCGAPSAGAARCSRCADLLSRRRRRERDRARLGAALESRIEAAVRSGRGIRLSAADVAALATREGEG